MTIWFDMDGTIADLYSVENWLPMLRAYDPSPYMLAKPRVRLSTLAYMLNRLRAKGYRVGVISWGSKCSTPAYDAAVTAAVPAEQADVAAAPDPADEPASEEVRAVDEPPLAWHRFLTKFWLWLAALYHAFQAGWLLLGRQYYTAEIREKVYAGLPKLCMLDWALAVVAGVAALLCVLSAVKLRKRRSAGPRLLCGTYLLLLTGLRRCPSPRWGRWRCILRCCW